MDNFWFDRTISAFPVSIGTSLALESLFKGPLPPYDPAREIPNRVEYSHYHVFYLNIETLLRNLIGSLKNADDFLKAKPKDAAEILQQEIETIQTILVEKGKDRTKAVFYYFPFENKLSLKNNKHIGLRQANTEKQKYHKNFVEQTLSLFMQSYQDDRIIRTFKNDIRPSGRPIALILTHRPYDLGRSDLFQQLDLIESHTGKLKNKTQWFTKYYPLATFDMSCLPMNRRLLYIFGDHVNFSPWSVKGRKEIFDIAQRHHWNYATTDERVLMTLQMDLKDLYMRETITEFPI